VQLDAGARAAALRVRLQALLTRTAAADGASRLLTRSTPARQMHTLAAHYPTAPSTYEQAHARNFFRALAALYPCTHCREDFHASVAAQPPRYARCSGVRRCVRASRVRRFGQRACASHARYTAACTSQG
jgi:hypothetical protein